MATMSVADIPANAFQNRDDGSERIALRFLDETLTYAELNVQLDALAQGLVRAGMSKGDRVAIHLHNRLEFVVIFFAVARVGAVAVPINYLLSPAEIAYQFNDAGVSWAFTAANMKTGLPEPSQVEQEVRIVELDGDGTDGAISYSSLIEASTDRVAYADISGEDPVLLQYTSGTTGFPKGATHTHNTVLWNTLHQVPDCALTEDEVYLSLPALCWAAGLHDFTLSVLWVGGTVVVHPSRGLDVTEVLRSLEKNRVTLVLVVPSVLQQMVESPEIDRRDLSFLRSVYTGSAPVPVEVLERAAQHLPEARMLQAYGMSEFPTLMTVLAPEFAMEKLGSAGRPTLCTMLRVVDAQGHDCGQGEPGEIVIKSPATMVGYFGRESANAEAFRDGWFHTGDLGHLDPDGFLYIAGRQKDMIISGGLNVYPAEVELALASHPGIAECAVVGTADPQRGEVGVAFVVARPGSELDPDELTTYARNKLAHYKVPRYWNVLSEQLPRTASGKVAKGVLRELSTEKPLEAEASS